MFNLFLSFILASGFAAGLVTLSRITGLEHYTSRVFPMVPLLYAIIYQFLERLRTGKATPLPPERMKPETLKKEMRSGLSRLFGSISLDRMIAAVGISFLIKIIIESAISFIFIYITESTFSELYGTFSVNVVAHFLRGEHPWLRGTEGLYMLVYLAITTSIGTGMWIGLTSKTSALIEGVIVGMLVTVFSTMTNMLFLYQRIEEMALKMAKSMGYNMPVGFVIVIAFQVMLYGLWSGIFQKIKFDRMARKKKKR